MFRKKKKYEPVFTGSCLVRQHTADLQYVGRCYYATYDGICHLHGNVTMWLDGTYTDWPRDYELARVSSQS